MKPKRARRPRPGSATVSVQAREQRPRRDVMAPPDGRGDGAQAGTAPTHPVYDIAMVDEVRSLWRRGQWTSLASLTAADLQSHPDRAQFAVLVAVAHQATGNRAGAAHFIDLAGRWGADRESIARALLAGVHNTLGRASAMAGTRPSTVYRHFEQSVSFCGMRPASESMVQTRLEAQLPPEAARPTPSSIVQDPDGSRQLTGLSLQLQALRIHLDAATAKLETRVESLLPALGDLLRRELANSARQIESHANLQAFFAGQALMPELHGWPVSPDLAVHLVRLLTTMSFDGVVEFGSGSSTVLLARALRHKSVQRPARQIAFEHLAFFRSQTLALLREAGLDHSARVVLAPLKSQPLRDGPALYYDCDEALAELSRELSADCPTRLLVLVDGPPANTGPLARLPALEMLLRHFSNSEIVLLLDDFRREDEREVARRWRQHLDDHGIPFTALELELDKGAFQLTIGLQPLGPVSSLNWTGT